MKKMEKFRGRGKRTLKMNPRDDYLGKNEHERSWMHALNSSSDKPRFEICKNENEEIAFTCAIHGHSAEPYVYPRYFNMRQYQRIGRS